MHRVLISFPTIHGGEHPVRHIRCIKTARRSFAYYLSYSRVVPESHTLDCVLKQELGRPAGAYRIVHQDYVETISTCTRPLYFAL